MRRKVAGMLKRSDLRIQELRAELVITNPMEPERGRIRVEYGDGFVCLEKTSWECLGNLEGYEDEEDGTGTGVSAEQILRTLGGHQPPGGHASGTDEAPCSEVVHD
jgi:hypothetical protein